jgi:chromosome segregation ATPase
MSSFSLFILLLLQTATDKRDPFAAQAYKAVVAIRSGFEKIFNTVSETGKTKNEIMDLEGRIDQAQRTSSLDITKVQDDINGVKAENKQLTEKLKELKKKINKT